MLDPYLETVRFALFALVIGFVVFGGATLAYFLDKRRPDSPTSVPAQGLQLGSKVPEAGENPEAPRDKAA